MKKRTLYNEYPAYLKSDILPFEIPMIFSNDEFYKYILKTSKQYRKILNGVDFSYMQSTIPFTFNSYVRENKSREITIINPFSYMYILKYIKTYEKIYLNEFKNNKFSIRYPKSKMNDYQYNNKAIRTNSYVDHVDKVEKKNGTYYNIYRYKRSYEFENSNFFQKQMSKYKYFYKLDIKACFDSIYTHSYKWLVTNNFNESKAVRNTTNIYAVTDKLMQSINNHKTNGILIGPEFMRLSAELLLTGIDEKVSEEMIGKEYNKTKIYRFIDDFYIFSENEEEIEKVKNIIEHKYKEFQLRFNDRKLIKHDDFFILNEWYTEITYMLNSLDISKFFTPPNKKIILDILVKFKKQRATVVAYITSTILNTINDEIEEVRKIKNIEKEDLEKNIELYQEYEKLYKYHIKNIQVISKDEIYEKYEELKVLYLKKKIIKEKRLFKIFEELIFYLRMSPKYINSLKILSLAIECLILEKELPLGLSIDYKTVLKNVLNRELFIIRDFEENFDDVSNILLLYEYLGIEIEPKELKTIVDKDEENYMRIAIVYRYCVNTNKKKYKTLINKIEEIIRIDNEIEENLGEDVNIWKVLLFPILNMDKIKETQNTKIIEEYIIKFLNNGGNFIDYKPLKNIEDLKILNIKIYYKSLVNINY